MKPEVVVFIVVVVVYFLGTEGLKKYFDLKLQVLYAGGLYKECIELLDRRLARIVMTTYKQYYMRFVIYEAEGNTVAAERMLEHVLNMKSSKSKRAGLVAQAFNFYVMAGNRKQAKVMLQELKASDQKAVAADCQLTYDIVFGKRCDEIERMEAMLDRADPAMKTKLYMLLSHQYANAGDKQRARKYRRLCDEQVEKNRPHVPASKQ